MKERKTFTFDGENSADYGLYISGDSVYNAPNREIDMVSIPGRNGQLAIDMGRYENITVTYPAFVFADTQEEFREKIRRIRNWLCSKTSYQRLTDEYNPESFRLGLYKSGLEVEPIFYNRCGEFEMSFDCKPQRFLFTGEEVFTLGEWGETETYSGSIVSFEGTETTAIKTLNASIVPKQSGSGDPSPSNVRPISGYEGVNVNVKGKNLLYVPTYAEIMACSSVGSYKNYPIKLKPNATYYFSGSTINGYSSVGKGLYVLLTISDSGIADWKSLAHTASGIVQGAITTNESGYIYLRALGMTEASWNEFRANTLAQIELGSTATDYEPYEGESKSISLGQTVYGGTLEVMSGKLTITKVLRNLGTDQSGSWYMASTSVSGKQRLAVGISGIKTPNSAVICNLYKTASGRDIYNGVEGIGTDGNDRLLFYNANLQTVADWKSWATTNNLTVVYELATPTEIQLTPTEVKTLLGANNIWADSGDVIVEIGENPYILVNPTKFEATPIFEVEGSGTLSVGDTTLTINNEGTTIIDTEMMEAYEDDNGAIISRNDDVEGGFPTLTSGINNVEADGLTSVKVTPKWWEL